MSDHPTPLGGTGGSTVIIDVDRRITFAYVQERLFTRFLRITLGYKWRE